MFLRVLFESLARRKSRKALAALSIWIGLSLVVGMLTLSLDVGDKMNRELRAFGANILVEPVAAALPVRVGGYLLASAGDTATLKGSDLAALKTIFWRNNISPQDRRADVVVGRPDSDSVLLECGGGAGCRRARAPV